MSQGSSNPKVTTVTDVTELTAFGEQRVAELTPIAGWTFVYNLITGIVTKATTGSAQVTVSASRAKLESGAAISQYAKVYTKRALRYTPGVGGLARMTCVFETAGTAGNTRTIGIQNTTDGFAFGYNGTSFGIRRRRNSVDVWYPQTSWNINTCPWLLPAFGNIYQVNYQWLGYGAIRFSLEDPATGKIIPVHTIYYANTSADVSILNPNLPIEMTNENDGTCNTNCVMYSSSAMGFIENSALVPAHGPLDVPRTLTAAVNTSTGATLILIENQTTINGVTNRINLRLDDFNATSDGTKVANFVIVKNPTMNAPPPIIVYQNVLLDESPVRYSTTANMGYTGGTIIYAATLMKVDRMNARLDHLDLDILPGDTFVIAFTSTANTDVDVSLVWIEGY